MHNPMGNLAHVGFADAALVENLARGLLANRFPSGWLGRLAFEDMDRVPDTWVAPQWRCADLVAAIPLVSDGPEPQTTHTVVAVKLVRRATPELQDRLRRHIALLEREFDQRRVFGAPAHPPLVTAAVVEGQSRAKGPRAAGRKRVLRMNPGGVRYLP